MKNTNKNNWSEFLKWKIEQQIKNIDKQDQPLTEKQFYSLLKDHRFDMEKIKEIVLQMNNYKPLAKIYYSTYLTIQCWPNYNNNHLTY